MIARVFLLALIAPLLLGAAIVFEAAGKTAFALDAVAAAQASASPVVRARLQLQARDALERSWARPAHWHAGAAEALSGAYLLQGLSANEPRLLGESARWAARAVELAPIQPRAWARLALLAERGHANRLCDLATCLERSWRAGPMTDPETACARLQLAYRQGLLSLRDPRLAAYARSGVPRRQAAQCLAFLPASEVFRLLIAPD